MKNKFNPGDLVISSDEAKKDLYTLQGLDQVFLILGIYGYEDKGVYQYINLNTNTIEESNGHWLDKIYDNKSGTFTQNNYKLPNYKYIRNSNKRFAFEKGDIVCMNEEAIKYINGKYEKRIVEKAEGHFITLESINKYDSEGDTPHNPYASGWLDNKTYNGHILKGTELNSGDIVYIMDEKYNYHKHIKMVFMVTNITHKKIELIDLNNYTLFNIDIKSNFIYDRLYDAYDRIVTIENEKI